MIIRMDTGATYSFIQRHVVASRNLDTPDGFFRSRSIRIGGQEFGPLEMVVFPMEGALEIDALIGANFFSSHEVCFDFKERRMSILD